MAKIAYKLIKFRAPTLELIGKCNAIIERYVRDGYDMTLRQLYYQLVSSDEIPNKQKEYDRLGSIVNDARLAGLIDWDYIVDRTRNLRGLAHWENPGEIIKATSNQFRIDKWKNQLYRPEVWIEKDALSGVFERVCNELDVPFFSCRGYTSQSEMWSAAQRMVSHTKSENSSRRQIPFILHFGDHDPSGIDMSRDIKERLEMFETKLSFERLALNIEQIEEFNPPPNPAKLSDSRASVYVREFGSESWELDALEPDVLAVLVRKNIEILIDFDKWNEAVKREEDGRKALNQISKNFDSVQTFLNIQQNPGKPEFK